MLEHRGYAKKLARFNLRYGRGNGHLSFLESAIKRLVYLGGFTYLINEWFGIEIPKEVAFVAVVVYFVACYLVGWADELLGFWRQEAEYNTRQLNPYFEDLEKKVDLIVETVSHANLARTKGENQPGADTREDRVLDTQEIK